MNRVRVRVSVRVVRVRVVRVRVRVRVRVKGSCVWIVRTARRRRRMWCVLLEY